MILSTESAVVGKERIIEYQILIDSDAFVGRFFLDDSHYVQSKKLFEELEEAHASIVTTSAVIGETATVLSHRKGQELALQFLHVITRSQLPIIHIDAQIHNEALVLFKQQRERGTSYTDCANVAVLRQFTIPKIFSFDQVYEKRFGIELLA